MRLSCACLTRAPTPPWQTPDVRDYTAAESEELVRKATEAAEQVCVTEAEKASLEEHTRANPFKSARLARPLETRLLLSSFPFVLRMLLLAAPRRITICHQTLPRMEAQA